MSGVGPTLGVVDDELLSRTRASAPKRPILTGRHTGGRLPVGEQGLRAIDAHLVGVDASGLTGVGGKLHFTGCILEDCDFSGSDLSNVLLSGSIYNDASGSVFRRCDFTRADLRRVGHPRNPW